MRVSVVVPAYNEEKNISLCIKSLKNQSYATYEVVVVDDGSTDKTAQIAKKLGARVVSTSHLGRSGARNYGWKKANGEVIIFGDADTYFSKKWIAEIITKMNHYDVVADRRIVYKPDTFYLKCLQANYIINYHQYRPFCAWAMKKSVLLKTKGFDETLPVAEERDLGKRIKKAGYKIGYSKKAIQYHAGKPRLFLDGIKRVFIQSKDRVAYLKKYPHETPYTKLFCIFGGLFLPLLLLFVSKETGAFSFLFWWVTLYFLIFVKLGVTKRGFRLLKKKRYLFGLCGIRLSENIAASLGFVYGVFNKN